MVSVKYNHSDFFPRWGQQGADRRQILWWTAVFKKKWLNLRPQDHALPSHLSLEEAYSYLYLKDYENLKKVSWLESLPRAKWAVQCFIHEAPILWEEGAEVNMHHLQLRGCFFLQLQILIVASLERPLRPVIKTAVRLLHSAPVGARDSSAPKLQASRIRTSSLSRNSAGEKITFN